MNRIGVALFGILAHSFVASLLDSTATWLHGGARWAPELSSAYLLRSVEPGEYSIYFEENVLPEVVGSEPPPPGTRWAGGTVERQLLGVIEVTAGHTTSFDSTVD